MLRIRAVKPVYLALAAMLGAAAPIGAAHAASFDCDKAAASDEIAICANRSLDDADVEMATRYTMQLQLLPMGGAGALRDDQKAWLGWRRACGGDVTCLTNAYADRISALKAAFDAIAAKGPF